MQLVGLAHETPYSWAKRSVPAGCGLGTTDQPVPSQRSIRTPIPPINAASPTAKQLVALRHEIDTSSLNEPVAATGAIDHVAPS